MTSPCGLTSLPALLALAALMVALPVEIRPGPAGGMPGVGAAVALADDDDGGDDDGDDDGGGGGGGAPSGRSEGSGTPRASGPGLLEWLRGDDRPARPVRQTRRAPAPPPAAARGEVVASGLDDAALAGLQAQGFSVLARRPAAGGGDLVRLRVPRGVAEAEAVRRVAAARPGTRADLNHFYRPQQDGAPASSAAAPCAARICPSWQAVGWTPSGGRACLEGITIGVVDTGVNADHAVFGGRRIEVVNQRGADDPPSERKHGTAVVALLAGGPGSAVPGLVPEARIVAADPFVRGPGGDERTDVYSLVAAMDQLGAAGAQIVNLSLAGPENRVLADAVRRAIGAGRVLVAAVGNDGPRARPMFPAAYPHVIGVTAVDRSGRVYRRALQGAQVDLAAPGVEIPTAASIKGIRPQTGTSFAAPFVSAAAAILLAAEPGLTPQQVAERLAAGARDLGEPGWDPASGHGLVQAAGDCGPPIRPASFG